MPLPNWGQLEKSLTDSEKIEEAINRLIQDHNDDPNAHLAEGQSLYSHKAAEIIDHLVASIVSDKIKRGAIDLLKLSLTEHQFISVFESLDGWEKTLGVEAKIFGMAMQTGSTINTERKLSAEPFGDVKAIDFTKDTFFQTSICLGSNTNQLIYFIAGPCNLDVDDNGFGFKILNGTLYAIHIVGDGATRTEYTTEISGITITAWNVYRAELDAAAGKIYFYVNGILKATHDSNLPTGNAPVMMSYYIKNTVNANRILYSKYLIWSKKL
jgi:hypothetical protein